MKTIDILEYDIKEMATDYIAHVDLTNEEVVASLRKIADAIEAEGN